MKKIVSVTAMAFLLATAGAFAQTPSTTATPDATKTAKTAKTSKTARKGHHRPNKTATTPAPAPAQK